jgi:threonine/homoserine/homoserine lactone efflux protein
MGYDYGVDVSVLPAFLGAVLLICLAPGPDMAYLVATGIAAGRSAVTRGAFGITLGVLVYVVSVAAGLGAILATHPLVLTGLQLAGCLYLLWLARGTLLDARREIAADWVPARQHWFLRGLIVNLTNPKVLLFFLAFLPQFLGSASNTTMQLLMLGLCFQLVGLVTDLAIGWSAGVFRKILARPRARRIMGYASAGVFLALAGYAAIEALLALAPR